MYTQSNEIDNWCISDKLVACISNSWKSTLYLPVHEVVSVVPYVSQYTAVNTAPGSWSLCTEIITYYLNNGIKHRWFR